MKLIFKSNMIAQSALFEMSASGVTVSRMNVDQSSNSLPFNTYLPYNYSTPVIHRFTILAQYFIVFIAGHIQAGFDTLFPGIMMQICAKLAILKHRFRIVVIILGKMHETRTFSSKYYENVDKKLINDWIESHNAILSLYDNIESVFSKVIFVQYFMSALSLCITVYFISQMRIFTMEFIGNFVFLIASTTEIFALCFSANQVTLEVCIRQFTIPNGTI
ncbi:hypothetical protein PV327_005181 [Microctonus hyperodae]|uniref:Uncharacterized protein n=1 Tax=Microctonus hyperodae TaxID=165561 RepID=A0AA39G0U8_MICHY|nr:hypothetical protein PV327_005181 [Microctonus hyperodae]